MLVTGAGGSIGSELCRQCARHGVARIALLEISELALITIQQELQADVQAAVNHLADGLRVPVLLYYMGDLSIAEIASELHIPAGTVKRRLYQARQLLRQEMEANGYGEA